MEDFLNHTVILFIIITIGILIYFYCFCSTILEIGDINESLKYKDLFINKLDSVQYINPELAKDQIFVSIASYRDPECPKTVSNLINTAKFPKNLWIHIYEQNGIDDKSVSDLPQNLLGKSNVFVDTVSYEKAMGPNWARYLIQKKWKNEEYFLQIDSHTLFVKDWDIELIDMLNKLPKLSVLTQYPPEYNLKTREYNPNSLRTGLYVEGIREKDHFTRIQSEYNTELGEITKPFKSEAWGACFSFSTSEILRDAPYDPYLPYLFFGEELDITLRLFTRGWKFWSPRKALVYTSFKRDHRRTFWKDHDDLKRKQIELLSRLRLYYKFGFQDQIDQLNYKKLDILVILKDIEKFGMGSAKSISDYEDFAGIDFKNRTVKGHNRDRIISINRPKQLMLNNIKIWEYL